MHEDAPTSAKILSHIDDGHAVEMWWNDSEEERERFDIWRKIRIRPATEDELGELYNPDAIGNAVEEIVDEDGEVVSTEKIGQPGIDKRVRNRSWTVVEDWSADE